MRSVRRALLPLASLLLAAAGLSSLSTPAHAAAGTDGGKGFQLTVTAQVTSTSGDAGFVPTGSIGISVPPKCWWSGFGADQYRPAGSDLKAMEKYFNETRNGMRGHAAAGYYAIPSAEKVAAVTKAGTATWYELESDGQTDCLKIGFQELGGTVGGVTQGGPWSEDVGVSYAAFNGPDDLPPPVVDIEDVVDELWDQAQQNIEGPLLDRNPQIAAAGNATLVNIPTWMWVTNQEMALATDGQVDLHVEIPGTPVQADLTSKTDGVAVSSDAGSNNCTVDQATSEWAKGSQDAAGCTIAFDTANHGGWGVSATTNWTGRWEGTDYLGAYGPEPLDPVTASAVTTIPVAESVALVRDAR